MFQINSKLPPTVQKAVHPQTSSIITLTSNKCHHSGSIGKQMQFSNRDDQTSPTSAIMSIASRPKNTSDMNFSLKNQNDNNKKRSPLRFRPASPPYAGQLQNSGDKLN